MRDAWLGLPEGVRAAIIVAAFIVIGLVALPAQAEEITTSNGEDSVTLTDEPCSSAAVLAQLAPRFRDVVHNARATVHGAPYAACWMIDGDSVHLLYENGDQGLIPLTDFGKKPGAAARSGPYT